MPQHIPKEVDAVHDIGSQGVVITRRQIDGYLESIRAKGLSKDTCKQYSAKLEIFYRFLSTDKLVRQGNSRTLAGKADRRWLCPAHGESIAVGRKQLFSLAGSARPAMHAIDEAPKGCAAELTRNEYLRLLQTAKIHNKHRTYLLVKVFATTGIIIGELPEMTGRSHEGRKLDHRKRIEETSAYVSQTACKRNYWNTQRKKEYDLARYSLRVGKLMVRAHVNACIHELCNDARVDDEKGNPRCLRRLYQETRQDIQRNMQLLLDQTYNRMIEAEQCTTGWEQR